MYRFDAEISIHCVHNTEMQFKHKMVKLKNKLVICVIRLGRYLILTFISIGISYLRKRKRIKRLKEKQAYGSHVIIKNG
jgi:hypothetical protein